MVTTNKNTTMDAKPKTGSAQQKSPTPLAISAPNSPLQEPSKSSSSSALKRKFEPAEIEAKEDWDELGEPIQKTKKSVTQKRIEVRSANFLMGLAINQKWCEACEYSELLDILHAQGWVHLLGTSFVNVLSYNSLEEFCHYFSFSDGICYSLVKGKKIEFDAQELSELLGVPNYGFDEYFKGAFEEEVDGVKVRKSVEGVEIGKIVESIGGNSEHVKTSLHLFSPLQKVLFHLVFQSIIPRSQHRNDANHLDAILMYCLENKIQINFPSLMIQHLSHSIENKLKIGYGNLLITIFESFKVPHDKEFLAMQTNHFIQLRTLKSWGLCVENGKTVWCESKKIKEKETQEKEEEKQDVDVDMGEAGEESVVVVEPTEMSIQKEEQGRKTSGRGRGRGGIKRKSIRLVPKPKPKTNVAEFLALDDDEDEKEELKTEPEKVEEKAMEDPSPTTEAAPTFGFSPFSSSHILKELKEIKAYLKQGEETQRVLEAKLNALDDKVSRKEADARVVLEELQNGIDMLSQNQVDLKLKLEDMVAEVQPDDDDAAV